MGARRVLEEARSRSLMATSARAPAGRRRGTPPGAPERPPQIAQGRRRRRRWPERAGPRSTRLRKGARRRR